MASVSPRIAELDVDNPDRHALFAGVLQLLVDRAALMIVEDVHWADEATLDLLLFIGRRIHRTRSMVVATYRSDETDSDHPLRGVLGDLATAPGNRRLFVEPLSRAGVAGLADGHAVDAADLYRLTGGNPFFVTEVIAAPGTSVPPTVADAVLARVSRLEPQVKAVLEWISVEPRPTERWLLEKLGHDPAAIDRALRSGTVIGDDDTVRFRHELARRALLETLDPSRVRTIHAAILEALDAAAKIDVARLSHHAMGAGDDAALLRWATRAGRIAALNRSHREAAGHFADAIAAAERSGGADGLPPESVIDLLDSYATELSILTRDSEVVDIQNQIVEITRDIGDEGRMAKALADAARAHWSAGNGKAVQPLIAEAIETVADVSQGWAAANVYATAGVLAMLARDGERAVERCTRAVALARKGRFDAPLVRALNGLGSARIGIYGDIGGIAELEQSAAIASTHGWDWDQCGALSNLGSGLGEVRHYERALHYLQASIDYATERDLDGRRHYSTA